MKQKLNLLITKLLEFLFTKDIQQTVIKLNKFQKFNKKFYKFNQIKLFINNKYILNCSITGFQLINQPIYNYKPIKKIEELDLSNYILCFYNYTFKHDGVEIKIKSHTILDQILINKMDNSLPKIINLTKSIELTKLNENENNDDENTTDNNNLNFIQFEEWLEK